MSPAIQKKIQKKSATTTSIVARAEKNKTLVRLVLGEIHEFFLSCSVRCRFLLVFRIRDVSAHQRFGKGLFLELDRRSCFGYSYISREQIYQ